MTQKYVKDGRDVEFQGDFNLALGRQDASLVKAIALANEDKNVLDSVAQYTQDAVQELQTLNQPAAYIPNFAFITTQDFLIAPIDFTDAVAHDLVAAALTETCRVHGIQLEVTAACIISLYSNGTGGTLLRKFRFAGAGVYNLEIRGRPRWVTGVNQKLTIISSTADPYSGQVEYVRSVP